MSDIKLIWDADLTGVDVVVENNDIAITDDLENSVFLSLFTDARLPPGSPRPSGELDRGGYWGDSFMDVDGDKTGSLLWTLRRAKQTPEVLSQARKYVQDALAWMTVDGVASRVEVVTEYPQEGWLAIGVTIVRPDGTNKPFRYFYNWAAQTVKR
jgi:phage gp46-like protein